jgi:hypothetical protein
MAKMTLRLLRGCQFVKSHGIGGSHMPQGVNKQIGTVAALEAKAHLVKVGLQMLRAHFMPRTDNAGVFESNRLLRVCEQTAQTCDKALIATVIAPIWKRAYILV